MSINQASITLTSAISSASPSVSVDDKRQFSNEDSFKLLYNSLNNKNKSTSDADLPRTDEKRTSGQLDRIDKRDLDRQRKETAAAEKKEQSVPISDKPRKSAKSEELHQTSSRAAVDQKQSSSSGKEVAAESGSVLPSAEQANAKSSAGGHADGGKANHVDSPESISQTKIQGNSNSLPEAPLEYLESVAGTSIASALTESDLQKLTGLLGDIESLSNNLQQNGTANISVLEQAKSVLELSASSISELNYNVDSQLAQLQVNTPSEKIPLLLANLQSVLTSLENLTKVLSSPQLNGPTVDNPLRDAGLISNSVSAAGAIKLGEAGLSEQQNLLVTEVENFKTSLRELRSSLNTQSALFNDGSAATQNKNSEAFQLGINNALQGAQSTAAIGTPLGAGVSLESIVGASKDLLVSKDNQAIQQLTQSSSVQRSSALGSSTEANLAATQANVLRLSSNNFLSQSAMPEELQANLKMMLSRGIPSAELQLKPASLGAMSIRIESSDEGSLVQFSVQSSVAKEQIEMHLPRLRELFAASQLSLGDVSVSTDDQKGADQQDQGSQAKLNTTTGEQNMANSQSQETIQAVAITSNNSMLDVYA